MLENLFPAETWKTVETTCKTLTVLLAGFAFVNGAIAWLANRNADLQAKAPRELSSKEPVPALKPFKVLVSIYGGKEAVSFAEKLITTMPAGTFVSRFDIGIFHGAPAPSGLSYNARGRDATPLLAWLAFMHLDAKATDVAGAPVGLMMSLPPDVVVLFVGPKDAATTSQ